MELDLVSRREVGGRTSGYANMAKRVRHALLALGGEAHRAVVIQFVARELGYDTRKVPSQLQDAVILAFEANLRDERRRATFGFHLPFGEGSYRWGVLSAA